MEGSVIVERLLEETERMKIIQEIIEKGEDFTTDFFMGSFSATAKENRDKF